MARAPRASRARLTPEERAAVARENQKRMMTPEVRARVDLKKRLKHQWECDLVPNPWDVEN